MRKLAAVLREWAPLVLAVFVLNFALTFHNVWPTPWITTRHELSIEIAVLVLVLALYARFARAIAARAVTALAIVLTVMTIGRYAEVTAPALYGRAVNLYWDAQYLPHVAAMLIEVANPLEVAGLVVGGLVLLGAIFAGLRLALAHTARRLEEPGPRRVLGAAALALVAVYTAGHAPVSAPTLKFFSLPVTHTYWQQAEFVAAALGDTAAEMLPATDPLGTVAGAALGGADVVVQFVESYGATAFDAPEVAAAIAPARAELAAALAATNREVASAFVTSPTFGGASWLAHSSFMTGLDVHHSAAYDLLLTQRRATLASRFAAQGYRPLALMPGLKNEWPEGAFYGFERIYGARALDYRGPEFGWWRIPDQYALARFAALELKPSPRAPVLVFFPTITTHMPFRPVPPYQPDWGHVLSAEPFDAAEVAASLARLPEWSNMRPAYAETLAYTFTYLGGFFRANADARLIWIMLGDHQPAASVSGEGARADVPVHVIGGEALVAALVDRGFTAGLTPASAPLGPMHELPTLLLEAFAGVAPAPD